MEKQNILLKALEHFGTEHQIVKSIEAFAMLNVELSRRCNEQGLRIHILSELAEASIRLNQMKLLFGENEVNCLAARKMDILANQITEERTTSFNGIA